MAESSRVRINTPNVVGEEFEGEVVAVNLESGTYFSLMGSAADIWRRLSAGPADQSELVAELRHHYDCTGIDVADHVEWFLGEVGRLDLVVADSTAPQPPAQEATVDLTEKRPFEKPRVEAFNDLQDILLLDPIHDVDEAGWPVAAPPPAAP